jgi:hypothetical protein
VRCRIAPIKRADVAAFHAVVDVVAREKNYLASLKAPPLKQTRKFVLENLKKGNPQFVALHLAASSAGAMSCVLLATRNCIPGCLASGSSPHIAARASGAG